MLIAGANLPFTSYGFRLPDGGIAAIRDRQLVFAIAEERLSRNKKDGGFRLGLTTLRRNILARDELVERFVLSSCCDEVGATTFSSPASVKNVEYCGHHRAHALGSFAWSGFENAIAIVIDSGGDTFLPVIGGRWWEVGREQHSFFYLDRKQCQLIGRDCAGAFEIGFGEFYRAATYALGWHGARYAGNTMALGAIANPGRFSALEFFTDVGGKSQFPKGNDPSRKQALVLDWLQGMGVPTFRPRAPNDAFRDEHFEFAAWLQGELDRYLASTVERLVNLTGNTNVVLSGGVAYNCVAVGRLARSFPNLKFFLQPASGDAGQCVGNAVSGWHRETGELLNLRRPSASLGRAYKLSRSIRQRLNTISTTISKDANLEALTSSIAQGNICAIFQGRSEFGPRALGFRSLISLAEISENRVKMNRLKYRNYLMPTAPVIMEKDISKFFSLDETSPYMTKTVEIAKAYRNVLSSCNQGGGWARVQTVNQFENPALHRLLRNLELRGHLPVVLNTSLNGPGEPIVENLDEAVRWCENNSVDGAWINGNLFSFKDARDVLPFAYDASSFGYTLASHYSPENISDIIGVIFPGYDISARNRFLLNQEYIAWVRSQRKSTTIRFKPKAIEFPSSARLPVFASTKFEAFSDRTSRQQGFLEIRAVCYKQFRDLNEDDARNDGFSDRRELWSTLKEIYPTVEDDSMMSIFSIRF